MIFHMEICLSQCLDIKARCHFLFSVLGQTPKTAVWEGTRGSFSPLPSQLGDMRERVSFPTGLGADITSGLRPQANFQFSEFLQIPDGLWDKARISGLEWIVKLMELCIIRLRAEYTGLEFNSLHLHLRQIFAFIKIYSYAKSTGRTVDLLQYLGKGWGKCPHFPYKVSWRIVLTAYGLQLVYLLKGLHRYFCLFMYA